MISYRKRSTFRTRRHVAPDPPFYCATAISPYTAGRDPFISIDYIDVLATPPERGDVFVCDRPLEHFDREKMIREPLLVDASGVAEQVFRSGVDLLQAAVRQQFGVVHLVDLSGYVGEDVRPDVLVISFWPAELSLLRELCSRVAPGQAWGLAIPIVPPITTELDLLGSAIKIAAAAGALFCTAIALDVDPVARNAAASRVEDLDEETFAWLFDERFDLMITATQRHIAAVAAAHGLGDEVPLPATTPVNWRASALLARIGYKLQRMERDLELAWSLQKSARIVAALKKPIDIVASAASLSIISGLDEVSIDILEEWLRDGRSAYVAKIDDAWRLRRDHYR